MNTTLYDLEITKDEVKSPNPLDGLEAANLFQISTCSGYGIKIMYNLFLKNKAQFHQAEAILRNSGNFPASSIDHMIVTVTKVMPLIDKYQLKANPFVVREATKALNGPAGVFKQQMVLLLRREDATQLQVRALNHEYR